MGERERRGKGEGRNASFGSHCLIIPGLIQPSWGCRTRPSESLTCGRVCGKQEVSKVWSRQRTASMGAVPGAEGLI